MVGHIVLAFAAVRNRMKVSGRNPTKVLGNRGLVARLPSSTNTKA